MTGDEIYTQILSQGKGTVKSMCEVAERLVNTGIEKGIEKERVETIENMLRRGKTSEEISEFCGYSLEEVESIEAAMLQRV
jgi:hypothetical protein